LSADRIAALAPWRKTEVEEECSDSLLAPWRRTEVEEEECSDSLLAPWRIMGEGK
jgi:hypothetical protein